MDIKTSLSEWQFYGKVRNLILNLENHGEIVPKLSQRNKLNNIFMELKALKVP